MPRSIQLVRRQTGLAVCLDYREAANSRAVNVFCEKVAPPPPPTQAPFFTVWVLASSIFLAESRSVSFVSGP